MVAGNYFPLINDMLKKSYKNYIHVYTKGFQKVIKEKNKAQAVKYNIGSLE